MVGIGLRNSQSNQSETHRMIKIKYQNTKLETNHVMISTIQRESERKSTEHASEQSNKNHIKWSHRSSVCYNAITCPRFIWVSFIIKPGTWLHCLKIGELNKFIYTHTYSHRHMPYAGCYTAIPYVVCNNRIYSPNIHNNGFSSYLNEITARIKMNKTHTHTAQHQVTNTHTVTENV